MTPKQQDTQEDRAESTGPPLQEVSVGIPSKFVTEPFKEVQSNPCQPTPDTPVGWSTHFSLSPSDRTKVFCEVLTQGAFNYCSCAAAVAAETNAAGSPLVAKILCMTAHMVILPLIIFTFGPVSGAHFNPMVTATFVATRAMDLHLGIYYVVAQLLGGVLGSAAAFQSLSGADRSSSFPGLNTVPKDHTALQAFMGEVYASFLFILVLYGTVVDKRGWGKFGPIAVGLVVPLLMWLEGPVSSMCINPARAFGPALILWSWRQHWIFWTAPFLGGIPAGVIYSQLFAAEVLSQERKTIRAPPSSLPSPSPSLPLPPWLKRSASGSNVQQAPILCQVSIQRPPEGEGKDGASMTRRSSELIRNRAEEATNLHQNARQGAPILIVLIHSPYGETASTRRGGKTLSNAQ